VRRLLVCAIIAVAFALPAVAKDYPPTHGPIELEDGDSVVFLGDSITHQCLYSQYVEDYYYTRYPGRRIRFHNAGVGGNRAIDALKRFDDDVAAHKPDYVLVLLGMNDGRYASIEDEIIDTYVKDMTELVDRIEGAGATPIIMTPTMFDVRISGINKYTFPAEATELNYNSTLLYFGAWLYEQATNRGLAYIDAHEPLQRLTREGRRKDPAFTLIQDSIHPDPPGHAIMALAFLKGIGAEPLVSDIHADYVDGKWVVEGHNGEISDIAKDGLAFRFKAKSLPWVVPEDAALGFKMADAGSIMSRERITVTGLKPGDYALKLDDVSVGTYSHIAFAAGVELQQNRLTPQHRQAMKVASLNKERNEKYVHALREHWMRSSRPGLVHENEATRLVWSYDKKSSGNWTAEETPMRSPEGAVVHKISIPGWNNEGEGPIDSEKGWVGINGFSTSEHVHTFHWLTSDDGDNVNLATPIQAGEFGFDTGEGDLAFRLLDEEGKPIGHGQEPAPSIRGLPTMLAARPKQIRLDSFRADSAICGIEFWGYWLDADGKPGKIHTNRSGFNIWFYEDSGGRPEGGIVNPEHDENQLWKVAFRKKADELSAKAKQMEDEIYAINQPQPHRYEIVGL